MSIIDKLNQIKEIKIAIKEALIEKGAEITSSTPFSNYAEIIENLETGGGKVITDSIKTSETINENVSNVIRDSVRVYIETQNPIMTSNSMNGWAASASQANSGNEAYKGFNKDMTGENCWWTGRPITFPCWISLSFNTLYKIHSVEIMNESVTPDNFKNGLIQFRTSDTAEWETLYEITDRPNTTSYTETYRIESDTLYKEFRLFITSVYGTSATLQNININFKEDIL